jgi:hypothetical protein
MIEPELQNYLSGINQSLTEIKNKKQPGIWRAFFHGMFGAFGYLVGIVVVVVIVGWFLQKTGLIAPFQVQWQKFQKFMTDAENTLNSSQSASQNTQQGTEAPVGTIITLPNGQKVQVVQ